MNKNFYFFIGTTAELIKLAPVLNEFKKRKVDYKLITSGQNEIVFDEFASMIGNQEIYHSFVVKPLKLSIHPVADFFIWGLRSFFLFLFYFRKEFSSANKKNTIFIVHGDTVSSVLGATIARIFGIKIAHIESGLRSFNFLEPFPEELSRFIVSRFSDIHFCPNKWSMGNLKLKKGVKINTINNTLIQSLHLCLNHPVNTKFVNSLRAKKFFLLILHRQEHIFFEKSLTKKYLKLMLENQEKDMICVLVLHKLTEDFLIGENLMNKLKSKNIILVPRLPYPEFMNVMKMAQFVATDGGSNQEESYYFGKPCLVLRNVTERIEGLGENVVLSKGRNTLIKDFIINYQKYKRKPIKINTSPSKIIVDYLLK